MPRWAAMMWTAWRGESAWKGGRGGGDRVGGGGVAVGGTGVKAVRARRGTVEEAGVAASAVAFAGAE